MAKVRKNKPINLKPNANGEVSKKQGVDQDIIFVVSTDRNLMPTVKLHERHPQAIFARPDD
jgi:hypothetical protein